MGFRCPLCPSPSRAEAEGCDFPGLGPHSFRRANITWRQQVGGSSIEASKIAGHSDLEMTGDYTFVTPERQNELTRRIQDRLADAAESPKPAEPGLTPPASSPSAAGLEHSNLASDLLHEIQPTRQPDPLISVWLT